MTSTAFPAPKRARPLLQQDQHLLQQHPASPSTRPGTSPGDRAPLLPHCPAPEDPRALPWGHGGKGHRRAVTRSPHSPGCRQHPRTVTDPQWTSLRIKGSGAAPEGLAALLHPSPERGTQHGAPGLPPHPAEDSLWGTLGASRSGPHAGMGTVMQSPAPAEDTPRLPQGHPKVTHTAPGRARRVKGGGGALHPAARPAAKPGFGPSYTRHCKATHQPNGSPSR